MLINAEDEDIAECDDRLEVGDINIKVVKQSENSPNYLLFKTKQVITGFLYILKKFFYFPFSVYSYCSKWKLQLDNDYIIVK